MRFKDKDKGKQRREKAYKFMIDQGLKPHLAAAVVGNLMQESYAHLDPTATNELGTLGIAQWLGDRKDRLISFAKEKGTDPTDFETQLEYLAFEVNNPDKYSWSKKQREEFFNAKTVEDAAFIFQKNFERAGESWEDEGAQRRIKNAKTIYLLHNDKAIYSKDSKGQIVNVNPEVATQEQIALSPKIRDEFYRQQFDIVTEKDQTETNDPPEAVQQAREAAKKKIEEKKQEQEFINKLREQNQQQQQQQKQQPREFEQPRPVDPREMTPDQNEFFGSFIPQGW